MAVQLSGAKHHKTVITQSDYAVDDNMAKKDKRSSSAPQGSHSFNIRGDSDAVLMRKEIARKRARKAIEDAWAGDREISSDVEMRKENLKELQSEIAQKSGYLMAYNDKKAKLREEYAIDENSEEHKALLEKREHALANPEMILTQEEKKRLAEIDEYEARVREMDQICFEMWTDRKTGLRDMLLDEEAGIAAITAIHQERLKFREMTNAQNSAKKIEAAAGEDIITMLAGEAKSYISESLNEKREEAKERAEEKGKQEEKLEAQKTEKELMQKRFELEQTENRETEEARIERQKNARKQEDILMDVEKSSTGTASTSSQTRIEIKEMLHKMNLLEEDLKGMEVDDAI